MNQSNVNEEDLKYSLYHLFVLNKNIDNCLYSLHDLERSNLKEVNRESEIIIFSATIFFCVIRTCAYLDEINYKFLKEKYNNKLTQELEKIIGEINSSWPDLKEFRNEILAHNFRIRNQGYKSIFESKGYAAYQVPADLNEMQKLFDKIGLITTILDNYFPQYFEEFRKGSLPTNRNEV